MCMCNHTRVCVHPYSKVRGSIACCSVDNEVYYDTRFEECVKCVANSNGTDNPTMELTTPMREREREREMGQRRTVNEMKARAFEDACCRCKVA